MCLTERGGHCVVRQLFGWGEVVNIACGVTNKNLKHYALQARNTFLSLKLTFLTLKLTVLTLKLTFLSSQAQQPPT